MAFTGFAQIIALAAATVLFMGSQASAQGGPHVTVDNVPLPVTGSVTLAPNAGVQVTNPENNPVNVRSTNDALQPWQASHSCQSLGCDMAVTVPQAKRLVIEYASVSICASPGMTEQMSIETVVGSPVGTPDTIFDLTPTPPTPSSGNFACGATTGASRLAAASQVVRIYADPGTSVAIRALSTSNPTGAGLTRMSVSGYLVDLP